MFGEYLKSKVKSAEFIVTAVGVLMGLLAVIMYGVLSAATENYFVSAWVFVLAILAIGVQAATALVEKLDDKLMIKNIAGIVATLLYVLALVVFVVNSIEWLGHLLSKDNVPAFHASYIVAIVFFVLSFVTQIVVNFVQREN